MQQQQKELIYKWLFFLMSYLELIKDQNERFCASHSMEIISWLRFN